MWFHMWFQTDIFAVTKWQCYKFSLIYLVKARKSLSQYFGTTFGTTFVSIGINVVPFLVSLLNLGINAKLDFLAGTLSLDGASGTSLLDFKLNKVIYDYQ